MDQQMLRELEFRCIQEEPPWCTAACPLHVDVRAFSSHVGQGRWEDAWKVLHRHMPLPGILARICDAPCERRCKRQEVGDAISIGALERACVQTDPPAFRVLPMPAKGKTVALAGSGLSSLTAAWDLVRKGYAVTLFEAGTLPGATLRQLDPLRLPAEAIDRETAMLARLGVRFELECNPDTEEIAARCLTSFDAAYLGLDAVTGHIWGVEHDDNGEIHIDSKSRQTRRAGLFAGGRTDSPVWQAAQGRWAATSIDRFLQAVSITAARDREGPFETRLFSSLADVTPLPAVTASDAVRGYTRSEASAEARRCLQCECRACVNVCAFLEQFGAFPKKYAREIYNNLSIVMGEHKANRLINSCSLCGLCKQVCPNDFAMHDICLQARQTLVDNGKMPPSAHEFALEDMAFSQSEHCALARHQRGHEASSHVFFPGCQLCASSPEQVEMVYAHLRSVMPGGIGLMLDCCTAPAHWAGRREQFDAQTARIREQWDNLGQPIMILACAACMRIFTDHLPMIPTISLWSVLEANLANVAITGVSRRLAIHDPCTSRFETGLQACIRRLIAGAGLEIEELPMGRDQTECCGFGGLMQNANPELARKVVCRRAAHSSSDYITYCAMCRDNLAAIGKRAIHLLDIFFPDPRYGDPAMRPRPGWSQRRENRKQLKARLLESLWNEMPDTMRSFQTVPLEIYFKREQSALFEPPPRPSPAGGGSLRKTQIMPVWSISSELTACLDSRRILMEDIQQVIHQAQISGKRFYNPISGRYKAAYSPSKVTFWVEYTPTQTGCVVHNAYSHRMEVIGP